MGQIQKINFPYLLSPSAKDLPVQQRVVIFFGTDFYNLPLGSNQKLYIERSNQMLEYIRKNFPGRRWLYQPHPNEEKEFGLLNLEGFSVGEHAIAEVFLYENADKIEYVFSSCSWASGSAYAMGFDAAVFLDLLKDAIPDGAITSYHSYFTGLPGSFAITDFGQKLIPRIMTTRQSELAALGSLAESLGRSKTVWFLAEDPALGFRAAVLANKLKAELPNTNFGLLMVNHRRWKIIKSKSEVFRVFSEVITLAQRRIWFSFRPKKIWEAIRVALALKKLPIKPDDALVSLTNAVFEENCLLSFYPKVKKILLIESRWYNFIYESGSETLNPRDFRSSKGTIFFNYVLEPGLGLFRTIYKEHKDGKVLNIFRYAKPLEQIYDKIFVLMPGEL